MPTAAHLKRAFVQTLREREGSLRVTCAGSATAIFLEGREGVKWELGLACFCIGKTGFRSLGLGFESEKKAKMGMGLVFC